MAVPRYPPRSPPGRGSSSRRISEMVMHRFFFDASLSKLSQGSLNALLGSDRILFVPLSEDSDFLAEARGRENSFFFLARLVIILFIPLACAKVLHRSAKPLERSLCLPKILQFALILLSVHPS